MLMANTSSRCRQATCRCNRVLQPHQRLGSAARGGLDVGGGAAAAWHRCMSGPQCHAAMIAGWWQQANSHELHLMHRLQESCTRARATGRMICHLLRAAAPRTWACSLASSSPLVLRVVNLIPLAWPGQQVARHAAVLVEGGGVQGGDLGVGQAAAAAVAGSRGSGVGAPARRGWMAMVAICPWSRSSTTLLRASPGPCTSSSVLESASGMRLAMLARCAVLESSCLLSWRQRLAARLYTRHRNSTCRSAGPREGRFGPRAPPRAPQAAGSGAGAARAVSLRPLYKPGLQAAGDNSTQVKTTRLQDRAAAIMSLTDAAIRALERSTITHNRTVLKEDLRAACEARGIAAPKSATKIVMLDLLLAQIANNASQPRRAVAPTPATPGEKLPRYRSSTAPGSFCNAAIHWPPPCALQRPLPPPPSPPRPAPRAA
jgi:hypothetical protein